MPTCMHIHRFLNVINKTAFIAEEPTETLREGNEITFPRCQFPQLSVSRLRTISVF
jgi:hypothetical protein